MKLRNNLDDFMSIVCFKAAIKGMEDILGEEGTAAALIAAGRARGKEVASSTGIAGTNPPVDQLAQTLNGVFGASGTRLCQIEEVQETPEGGYLVKTSETVCMAGESGGTSRRCTYTLGAVMGAIESAYGKSLRGQHSAKSTEGSPTDDFLLNP